MPICIVCQQFYQAGREATCSDECHEEFIRRVITQFGEFKKVVRQSTGIAYKVPTRDIVDKGLKEEELDQYPIWEDETAF
jgi:hypothetical protein